MDDELGHGRRADNGRDECDEQEKGANEDPRSPPQSPPVNYRCRLGVRHGHNVVVGKQLPAPASQHEPVEEDHFAEQQEEAKERPLVVQLHQRPHVVDAHQGDEHAQLVPFAVKHHVEGFVGRHNVHKRDLVDQQVARGRQLHLENAQAGVHHLDFVGGVEAGDEDLEEAAVDAGDGARAGAEGVRVRVEEQGELVVVQVGQFVGGKAGGEGWRVEEGVEGGGGRFKGVVDEGKEGGGGGAE